MSFISGLLSVSVLLSALVLSFSFDSSVSVSSLSLFRGNLGVLGLNIFGDDFMVLTREEANSEKSTLSMSDSSSSSAIGG